MNGVIRDTGRDAGQSDGLRSWIRLLDSTFREWRGRADQRAWRAQRVVRAAVKSLWVGAVDFYNGNSLTHASSIAYFALLSLFPLLLLILAFLGTATASDEDRAAVLGFVLRYFPRQFDFITQQLDAFRSSRVPLGIAGFFLTIWGALGVFGAITTAVNQTWGVERQPSYLKHKLVSFVMLLTCGLLLLLALALVSAHGVVHASWFAAVLARAPNLAWLGSFVTRWATTALFFIVVGLVMFFVPNTRVRFRDVWFGALVSAILWHWALRAFSWYVGDLSRFSIHGSIAAVVFLLWIYISAVIFLVGVTVAAAHTRLLRDQQGDMGAV
jgi:membrane protein